jgi:hypothetical protein
VEKNEQRNALVDATGFLPDARRRSNNRKQTRQRKNLSIAPLYRLKFLDIRAELQLKFSNTVGEIVYCVILSTFSVKYLLESKYFDYFSARSGRQVCCE